MAWTKGETYKLKRPYGPMNDMEAVFTFDEEKGKTVDLTFPFNGSLGYVTVLKTEFTHYFTLVNVPRIGTCKWQFVDYRLRKELKDDGILSDVEIGMIFYRTNGAVTDVRLKGEKTPKRIYRAKCMPEDKFCLKEGVKIAASKAFADLYHQKILENAERYADFIRSYAEACGSKEGK